MPRFLSVLCAALLMLLSANTHAETNVCNSGIGGTGIQQDGIGGTGKQADSGVGGTGIVGIVTGFASICVNGIEVIYDKQTEVDVDGLASNIDALNIGQLVAIESSSKSNQIIAQRVSVAHVMIGKIEEMDLAQNTLQVMGQTVNLSPQTIINADLKAQQLVKISGLVAANKQVFASRIDLAKADTPSQLAGLIDQAGSIHGINIASANPIPTGSMIRVSGSWDGNKLIANEIEQSAIQRVLTRADNVIIQDFAPGAAEHIITLHNQSISVDKHTKINGKNSNQNQTIIVYGRTDRAGKINARSMEYTNENKMLERGGSKHRPDANKSNSSDDKHEQERTKEVKDSSNKPETIERPEKTEKIEHIEKVEKTERPEKAEKAEKIEHIEKVEKIERPERHEGRNHLF